MMLRQYEAAATPTAILCKYFQDNRNASPYLLFMEYGLNCLYQQWTVDRDRNKLNLGAK